MLRNIIRSGRKLIENSRTFKSSVICRDKERSEDAKVSEIETFNDENEKEDGRLDDYWTTEPEMENPLNRATRVLGKQMRDIRNKMLFWKPPIHRSVWDEWTSATGSGIPTHNDVLIIGGGIMGYSIAYWLKKMGGDAWSVLVIDKNPFDHFNPMLLSNNCLRQQWGLEENVEMSQFGAEFFQDINKYLGIDGQPRIDVGFRPHSNLFIVNNEDDAQRLVDNARYLNHTGTKVSLMSPERLREKFPWMNTDGILVGSLGRESEGSFDPWALKNAFKMKCLSLGVEFVQAELKGFILKKEPNLMISSPSEVDLYNRLNHAVVKIADHSKKIVQFAICVIAAGAESSDVAKLMKIGSSKGMRSVTLPIEKRKRFLYGFDAPNGPGLNTPMVVDPSGCSFRRETLAHQFTATKFLNDDDEETFDEKPDPNDEFFHQKIFPKLVNRVSSFENAKLQNSWAGLTDYNVFDGNGIVGCHPFYNHVYFATGFGDYAAQMAPAVGRATMEYVKNTAYRTINLTRLSFDRFMTKETMRSAVY